jgi:hypothetical protein
MKIRLKWTVFLNGKKIAEIDEVKDLENEGFNFVVDLKQEKAKR